LISLQGLFESFEEIADDYEVQKIIKQNRAICYQIEGKFSIFFPLLDLKANFTATKQTIKRLTKDDILIKKMQKEANLDHPKELENAQQMLSMVLKNTLGKQKLLAEDSEYNRAHSEAVDNLIHDYFDDEHEFSKMAVVVEETIDINVDTEHGK
jgi:hypothetical protein